MSFINMPLGDAQDREVLEEGQFDMRIESVEEVPSASVDGQMNLRIRLKALDHPNSKSIFHYLAGFGPQDDGEKRNNKLLQMKAFLNTFHVPFEDTGFEKEDMLGQEGRVAVKQEEYEGTMQNKLAISW